MARALREGDTAHIMAYSRLLDDLIYTTRHGAGFILRRFGRVVPGGVYFVNPDDPLVDFTFPKEDHPQANDEALLAMTEQELRRWAAKPETCAVALAVETVRDGGRVMAIQAETRGEVAIVHCPLRQKLWWWVLGEAKEGEGLIVERFFENDCRGR